MNTFSTLKTTLAVAAISLSFIGAANAAGNHDGGLMKQMMNPAYQVKPITDPSVQSRLHAVSMSTDQDGGLMTEMTQVKLSQHFTQADQARIDHVVLTDIAG